MKAISYYRVSTKGQGESGLGLEGQERAVKSFAEHRGLEIIASFTEVESGKKNSRPKLHEAIEMCSREDATLLIAKLDRLARNAAFIMNLQDSKIKFIACDMPDANELTVGIMALVAQQEAKAISERTKAGLESARLRGIKLGRPKGKKHSEETKRKISKSVRKGAKSFDKMSLSIARNFRNEGKTYKSIADYLNQNGSTTPKGRKWSAGMVRTMIKQSAPIIENEKE